MSAVADTILAQLGGQKFIVMTGAHALLGGEYELQFSLPYGAKGGINKVRITLDSASDLYRVGFWRIAKRGLQCLCVASREHVYAEDLRALFTNVTGLDCTL